MTEKFLYDKILEEFARRTIQSTAIKSLGNSTLLDALTALLDKIEIKMSKNITIKPHSS